MVVLDPRLRATEVAVTPTVYEELDARFDNFRGHVLVGAHRFESDWSSWEIHPEGDEMVVLVSGAAEMVLERGGRRESSLLEAPGSYVVVPKGTWHTARIAVPTVLFFVTPGEGTLNAPGPPAAA